MRSYIITGIVMLFFLSAFAQTPANKVPSPSKKVSANSGNSVTVNGQPLTYRIIDGRYFVPVDDLARGLQASVSYNGGEVSINTASSYPVASPAAPRFTTIRGTLTYFFNENFGNKPDSGAEVWLIPGNVTMSNIAVHVGDSRTFTVSENGNARDYEVAKHTIADGNGNYEFSDVPFEGSYSVVIVSAHCKGKAMRDYLGKIEILPIIAKAGETTDASHDFGISDH